MDKPFPLSLDVRDATRQRAERSARTIAGVLTALIYLCFGVLIWQRSLWTRQQYPPTTETFAILQPHVLEKMRPRDPPPFLAHLIRPHSQSAAPPTFTIASEPTLQATPPVAATAVSTLAESPPLNGTTTGASFSGTGTKGIGASNAACLDPEWLSKLHSHIRHYFYSPRFIRYLVGVSPVFLRYSINREGRILELELAKSSGSEMLDNFAMERMHDADPLPAIPDRMHTDQLRGMVVLEFGPVNAGSTLGDC